jgi:hypothetical protein
MACIRQQHKSVSCPLLINCTYERTALRLWCVASFLFTPDMNSTFLRESNVSSTEDIELFTYSYIFCSVFLSLFYVPHIFCLYSVLPGSVQIGACGHRTVVYAHSTQTHPRWTKVMYACYGVRCTEWTAHYTIEISVE